MPSGLKFRIKEEEGLYYLCSEYISAGQLCRSAPLFSHKRKADFLVTWLIFSYDNFIIFEKPIEYEKIIFKNTLIIFLNYI